MTSENVSAISSAVSLVALVVAVVASILAARSRRRGLKQVQEAAIEGQAAADETAQSLKQDVEQLRADFRQLSDDLRQKSHQGSSDAPHNELPSSVQGAQREDLHDGQLSSLRSRLGKDRIVIIGGGASGALTAVRLAERGFDVTVLEKAAIGNGSSQRSAACIRAQFGVEETAIGMMYSERWYEQFHDMLKTPLGQRNENVIQQNGYLFLYEDPDQAAPPWKPAVRREADEAWKQALELAKMHKGIGLPIEILSPQDVHYRYPHIQPDRLIGATFCKTDGFLRHDLIYMRGIERAEELGVNVMRYTEVTGARLRGGKIAALETTRGNIEGDWFVNATNAWAPRVSQLIHGMPLPISPLKRYLYHLNRTVEIMDKTAWLAMPMTIYGMAGGRGAYSRPENWSASTDKNDQLMMGWAHETDPEPAFTDEDQDAIRPGFNHAVGVDNFGFAVLAEVEAFAPALANCGGITSTTSGFYGTTPDASPLIGIDRHVSNLVHAAGFSGHGLMHAPITAVLVEAIIVGDAEQGKVRLPEPYREKFIDLGTFDPKRDFSLSRHESKVL